MSTKKPKAIPLATLLEPDATRAPVKPGSSVVLHLTNTPNRNAHVLMGENVSAKDRGGRELRQAIVRELSESRQLERQRAAPFRKGRSTGLDREEERRRRERIRELGLKHPALTARKLYQHADTRPLRDEGVTLPTFANILSREAPRGRKRRT